MALCLEPSALCFLLALLAHFPRVGKNCRSEFKYTLYTVDLLYTVSTDPANPTTSLSPERSGPCKCSHKESINRSFKGSDSNQKIWQKRPHTGQITYFSDATTMRTNAILYFMP